ncbi:hypothetical protein PAPYR_13072 [Paratrimastix pyriformis]|uniref:Uncharacterized protein n=1 Tax=Paratrimastix pyriformis TaxID=342808 RepID=A0ABQ8U0V8_9EUKA|nr:hypothetical protein PAPYR_13072 [Paratrimastix pyriformis]
MDSLNGKTPHKEQVRFGSLGNIVSLPLRKPPYSQYIMGRVSRRKQTNQSSMQQMNIEARDQPFDSSARLQSPQQPQQLGQGQGPQLDQGQGPQLDQGQGPQLDQGQGPQLDQGQGPQLDQGLGPQLDQGQGPQLDQGQVPQETVVVDQETRMAYGQGYDDGYKDGHDAAGFPGWDQWKTSHKLEAAKEILARLDGRLGVAILTVTGLTEDHNVAEAKKSSALVLINGAQTLLVLCRALCSDSPDMDAALATADEVHNVINARTRVTAEQITTRPTGTHIPPHNSCATYQEPAIDPRSPLLSNWHTHSPAQLVCHLLKPIDRAPKYPSEQLAHLIENGAFRDAPEA